MYVYMVDACMDVPIGVRIDECMNVYIDGYTDVPMYHLLYVLLYVLLYLCPYVCRLNMYSPVPTFPQIMYLTFPSLDFPIYLMLIAGSHPQ